MKFTDLHTWIDVVDGIGTVGITSFAAQELGEVVSLQLPRVGEAVRKEQEVAVLESTKAATDMYAPMSGRVVEVNPRVQKDPALLGHAAQGEGWLFKVALTQLDELASLLDAEQYLALIART